MESQVSHARGCELSSRDLPSVVVQQRVASVARLWDYWAGLRKDLMSDDENDEEEDENGDAYDDNLFEVYDYIADVDDVFMGGGAGWLHSPAFSFGLRTSVMLPPRLSRGETGPGSWLTLLSVLDFFGWTRSRRRSAQ